jgi:hypothetical protein
VADFDRGIKAGVVAGIVYMAVAGILGAIYYNSFFSLPHVVLGTGLTLFTWASFTDPSFVISLLIQYIGRGIVFGAVFAALYSFLPGTAGIRKGVVLSAFLCIVALVGAIYTTLGWPNGGTIIDGIYYIGTLNLSSLSLALVGIISALVSGVLTGFLWGRFRGKELTEERKGRPVLLVSFILGGVIWLLPAVVFVPQVIINGGIPGLEPDSWWFDLLMMSVVFLGLPGWVLALVGWKKTQADKPGFKWGVAGGVMMALTGIMLLPGVLAIIGGVLSRRKPAIESVTGEIAQ